MNYDCPPDVDPAKELTLDALLLFHNFPQDVDKAAVQHLLDAEFTRHLKLCEAVILRQAAVNVFWAELPQHPVLEITRRAIAHFREIGFEVEVKKTARKESAPVSPGDGKPLDAVVIETRAYVSWLDASFSPALQAEFSRRRKLEDAYLAQNPPARLSTGFGPSLQPGQAVWAGCLDRKYVVEVQRRLGRSFLCLFSRKGQLLHCEPTNVSYGATFGPDVGDVAEWQRRAEKIALRLPSRRSPSTRAAGRSPQSQSASAATSPRRAKRSPKSDPSRQ